MKIYLAGKIGRDDWRHSIVLGLRDAIKPPKRDGTLVIMPDTWPILHNAVLGQHDYVGPFFMSTGLGDWHTSLKIHGDNLHGNAIADDTYCIESGAVTEEVWDSVTSNHGAMSNDPTRQLVIKLCLSAIVKADVVFVWMDSRTAYGTLVELGFAIAHRKPIWWGQVDRPYDQIGNDFWFAESLAESHAWAPDAKTALERMLAMKFQPKITGYVYILRSGDFIKIGKSKDVSQRLTQISPKTPMPVTLLHSIGCEDMSWAEAQLHQHFAHYRTNGEWFLLPQEELTWLLSLKTMSRALPDKMR